METQPFPDDNFAPALTEVVFDRMSHEGSELDLDDPEVGGVYGMHLAGANKPAGPKGVLRLELTGLYNQLRAGDGDERVRRIIGPGVLAAAVGHVASYNLSWLKYVEVGVAIGAEAYYFSTEIWDDFPEGITYPLASPIGKGLLEVRHGGYWLQERVADELPDEFYDAKKSELDTALAEAFLNTTGLPLEVRHLFDTPGEEGTAARMLIGCGVSAAFIVRFPDSVGDDTRISSAETMSEVATIKLRETVPGATTYLSVEPGNGHGALGVAATAAGFETFLSDNMSRPQ